MSNVQMLLGDRASSIQVDGQLSVLDQALSQGMSVNYSCKRGDCGQCVGTLVTGEVEPLNAGRPCIHDGNEVYLCNAIACTDLVVRLPYSPETEGLRVLRSPAKIHELKPLSADVLEVSLRLPPSADFRYLPGQYIRLTNKERITRSYSLAEAPAPEGRLHLHVRRVDDGDFSRYLFSQAKPGDLLHLEGPLGRFFLRESGSASKTIFLATGTGIAPIHAILSALTPSQRERCGELFLYCGNRLREDAYFHAPLVTLAKRLSLHYFTAFSREGHPQYVQDLMTAQHPSIEGAQVFASGNAAMINAARKQCLSSGLSADHFHADPFTAS